MFNYELTILFSGETDSKEIQEYFKSLQIKIEKEEKWGKKILSYPIKNQQEAFYIHWQLQIEKNKIYELKKKLNFNEKLIRYLLLKID